MENNKHLRISYGVKLPQILIIPYPLRCRTTELPEMLEYVVTAIGFLAEIGEGLVVDFLEVGHGNFNLF